jgi:hypothetical protein
MSTKLSPEAMAFFREQGRKGGMIGGKRSLETMTPEERVARARVASEAAKSARSKKLKEPNTTE